MKQTIILLIALAMLASCRRKAQSSVQTGDFKVEFLFENDGCKVYRFYDGGNYIYYSNCNGRVQYDKTTSHSNGKGGTTTTTQHYQIMTNANL